MEIFSLSYGSIGRPIFIRPPSGLIGRRAARYPWLDLTAAGGVRPGRRCATPDWRPWFTVLYPWLDLTAVRPGRRKGIRD